MTKLFENISNLIETQVPAFVADEHQKFVAFLKAYYEWLEDSEEGGTIFYTKALRDAIDIDKIDSSLSSLNDAFLKNYLKYIPPERDDSGEVDSSVVVVTTPTTNLDREKLTKQIQKLYSTKGGPDAYKFLFRVLFNKDVEIYYPKTDILRASNGKWTIPQAVRLTVSEALEDLDTTLLKQRKLYGEKSRAEAVIESAYKTIDRDSGREILEIFVSKSDQRPFTAGEYVIIDYVDANNLKQQIREKLIGSISNVKIGPLYEEVTQKPTETEVKLYEEITEEEKQTFYNDYVARNSIEGSISKSGRPIVFRRGTKYRGLEIDPETNAITYPGDPVVFYGGLAKTPDAIKAIAFVKNVTSGGIQTIDLIDAGLGYRTFTNTYVTTLTPTEGHGANIYVRSVDTGNAVNITVNTDTIEYKKDIELQAANFLFDNIGTSTIETAIGQAFAFTDVEVAPLKLVDVRQSGAGYKAPPEIEFETFYGSDLVSDTDGMIEIDVTPLEGPNTSSLYLSTDPITYYEGAYVLIVQKNSLATREMRKIVQAVPQDDESILLVVDRPFSSLIIENTKVFVENRPRMKDLGQVANVRIISGGTNYAVNDLILFNSSTSIGYGANAHVSEISGTGAITGITVTERGEGYYVAPDVSVQTTGGSGAILIVGILSNNEIANTVVDGYGEIQDFRITQRGFDYISTPSVSLKIKDVYVKPTDAFDKIIVSGERVWQNTGVTTDFTALIDFYDDANSMLRLYNYAGTLNVQNTFTTANIVTSSNVTFNVAQYSNGTYKVITYGDGRAKAYATWQNGLIDYDGYFLNNDGFLSSSKRLQGPRKYQTYSYVLIVEEALNKYKNTVMSLLHTTGSTMFGQYNIDRVVDVTPKETSLNVSILAPVLGSINANGDSVTIEGIGTSFNTTANANDMIVIDTGNTYREQSKYIVSVDSDTSLTLESNLSFIGLGRANVKSDNAVVSIYNTSVALSSFLSIGDLITVNVANTSNSLDSIVVTKEISVINDVTNRITCNSDFVGVNANGVIYVVSPFYDEVNYKIIPGA